MNEEDLNQEWYADSKEEDLSTVTVQEFEDLCASLYKQREECDKVADALKIENGKKSDLERKVMLYLASMDRKNYKSKLGTVTVVKETSYTLPKTEEDRAAFFQYLKDTGVFDSMITVHSKTFNSFLGEQRRIAEEEGRISDFSIPGVGEPSTFEKLRVMKGK